MKKNRIRLTESQLHRVIKESVKRVLKESGDTPEVALKIGKVDARNTLTNKGKKNDAYNHFFHKNGELTFPENGDFYYDGYDDYIEQAIRNCIDERGLDGFIRIICRFMIDYADPASVRACLDDMGYEDDEF